jgi:hypothetical protein
MAGQTRSILKNILDNWIPNTVGLIPWFQTFGAYRQLLKEYEKRNWVKNIGRGAYIRPKDVVDWTGGLYAIQYQMGILIFVGGKTAIELKGYAHNIPMNDGHHITLLGDGKKRLPSWFQKFNWDVDIDYRTLTIFPSSPTIELIEKEIGQYKLKLSSPERAILEVMALTPNVYTFEDSIHMMEGLMSLRPSILQLLLEKCTSIKTKKLFLYLADYCDMPWSTKLNLKSIKIGTGITSFCSNGTYISKYNIMVPKNMIKENVEDMP